MKTLNKILRKIKRLFGWRKPHPNNITKQFNLLVLNTARSMKRRKRLTKIKSVKFIETIWNTQ